jgi:hypothetical protein
VSLLGMWIIYVKTTNFSNPAKFSPMDKIRAVEQANSRENLRKKDYGTGKESKRG